MTCCHYLPPIYPLQTIYQGQRILFNIVKKTLKVPKGEECGSVLLRISDHQLIRHSRLPHNPKKNRSLNLTITVTGRRVKVH